MRRTIRVLLSLMALTSLPVLAQSSRAPAAFDGTWVAQDGAIIVITSDGNRIEGRLVAPGASLTGYGWKSGDLSFEAAITAQGIVGHLYDYVPAEAHKACPKVGRVIKNDLDARLVTPDTLAGRVKSSELRAAGCVLKDLGWGEWLAERKSFEVREAPKEIGITLLDTVLFDPNSDVLKPTAVGILEEIKVYVLDQHRFSKIVVEGHTDDRGSASYNRELSEGRSKAIVQWLAKNGIGLSLLEARGLGSSTPLLPNTSDANRAKNRRVSIKVRL